jgi:tRNA(fMet)-specific endonuclease VapC
MKQFLLDTDTVSFFLKNVKSVHARFIKESPESMGVSVITKAELLYGLKRNPAATSLHDKVHSFLRSATVIDWDSACAEIYAEIGADLAKRNQQIGKGDTMIAAHSMALGLVLITNNTRHYSRIPGLKLENWVDGSI